MAEKWNLFIRLKLINISLRHHRSFTAAAAHQARQPPIRAFYNLSPACLLLCADVHHLTKHGRTEGMVARELCHTAKVENAERCGETLRVIWCQVKSIREKRRRRGDFFPPPLFIFYTWFLWTNRPPPIILSQILVYVLLVKLPSPTLSPLSVCVLLFPSPPLRFSFPPQFNVRPFVPCLRHWFYVAVIIILLALLPLVQFPRKVRSGGHHTNIRHSSIRHDDMVLFQTGFRVDTVNVLIVGMRI